MPEKPSRSGGDSIVHDYRRFADAYGMVLILLLISIGFVALGSEQQGGAAISHALLGATMLFALEASDVRPVTMRVAMAAVGLTVILSAVAVFEDSHWAAIYTRVVAFALVVITMGAIVGRIGTHRKVSVQTVMGALAFYLLLGLLFAYFYSMVPIIWGVSPFVQIEKPLGIDYVYFSYITLATVGYGDVTPASALIKSTAILEALTGQLYLVSVVALLVSNLGRERRAESRD